jgi:hypothetical protein
MKNQSVTTFTQILLDVLNIQITTRKLMLHEWCTTTDCGLVVKFPGCRCRGPGSIPDAKRFFWEVVGLERSPLSLVSTIEEVLGSKSSGFGLEVREYSVGIRHADGNLYPQKLDTNFVDNWRSLGRYSSLADSGHGISLLLLYLSVNKTTLGTTAL